ncbi:MAG: endonuclease/exonuclease/phosphatase family protein [Hyphomicrobiaceae bacterium]
MARPMRLATFNLESLDLPPRSGMTLEERARILRPDLERLEADIVCFQEVNGQKVEGKAGRQLVALDRLVAGTPYAQYHRATTTRGDGVADVHNLVTLSRFAISKVTQVRHDLVPPVAHRLLTAEPRSEAAGPISFDRPLLAVDVEVGGGRRLSIVNLHLRAPLATSVPGQKLSPFVWKSVGGWAEGYFLSSVRRTAQALELRLLVDGMLSDDPDRLIVVAGDFNAEDHETPLKITVGAEEDTGNGALSAESLIVLDRALPADRRWSVLHHGRPQMLDHILASRALYGRFRGIEVHNEALGDEAVAYGRVANPPGSYHAAVVAEFDFDDSDAITG